jgi:hypothetical protein
VEVEVTGTFSFSVSSMQFIKKWIFYCQRMCTDS